jgi:heme-degrading monooxygenase HmoA
MAIRVICRCKIAEGDQDAFEQAYLTVTANVRGTPGHLRDELLRDLSGDGSSYVLLAEWESMDLFRAWSDDPAHIQASAPMFPYWMDTFQRQIFEVRACLDEPAERR